MSDWVQRGALALRDRARARAENARNRAKRERALGHLSLAERHEASAVAQDASAELAEGTRRIDIAVEGIRTRSRARAGPL
jgi:hypothetical protein